MACDFVETTDYLKELARDLVSDPNTPSWVLQASQWFIDGQISSNEFWDSSIFYANIEAIDGEIQQDIQLVKLGQETCSRSEEIQRTQDQLNEQVDDIYSVIAENAKWLTEVNDRLSQTAVDLGQSVTEAQNSSFWGNILGGVGGGSIVVIGIILLVVLKK